MNEVAPGRAEGEVPLTLKEARDRFEQAYVLRALEREDWNQSRAARGLGVHRNTLIPRLARVGLPPRPAGHQRKAGGGRWRPGVTGDSVSAPRESAQTLANVVAPSGAPRADNPDRSGLVSIRQTSRAQALWRCPTKRSS